ncbi:hypothetical protein [Phaeodactylibacter sp.]|jgi:hypothetical protein|uniref:hypothetical protein n=1 Tax=Phaeodactylibacter sp. TaxID=1940289 RepID=UPI0025F49405|nr:hypothetical protein [Phaeodactylibacter sp.]MCI4647951.1 hypothetical protein [Phaeodactylibacter sp.]MCI5089676.1 hypothetical protein [Phaeodactylibacter sp.]
MSKKKNEEEEKEEQPGVHKDLKGFEIKINEFGEISSNLDVEKLNQFLDKNVEDKKLKGRKSEDEEE